MNDIYLQLQIDSTVKNFILDMIQSNNLTYAMVENSLVKILSFIKDGVKEELALELAKESTPDDDS